MAERKRRPLSLNTLCDFLGAVGYDKYRVQQESNALVLTLRGDHTVLRLHVVIGTMPDGTPWYLRMLSYSTEIRPGELEIRPEELAQWLNQRNADLIFGRYYYVEPTDTIAFEVSAPCNAGITEEDFRDLLSVSTYSVDLAHADLIAMARSQGKQP